MEMLTWAAFRVEDEHLCLDTEVDDAFAWMQASCPSATCSRASPDYAMRTSATMFASTMTEL